MPFTYNSYSDRILVLDPSGKPLAPPQIYSNSPTFQIPTTGTYTILFEGSRYYYGPQSSVPYTITAFVDPVPAPLTIGARVTATLADSNASDRYTFTLNAPARLLFDSLIANSSATWTLTGPNNFNLSRSFYTSDGNYVGSDTIMNLGSGTYTLSIQTSGGGATAYDFRLLNMANSTALTLGTTVSASETPASAATIYAFNATAGDVLSITTTDTSGYISRKLYDPYGKLLFGPEGSGTHVITAAVSGQYTLIIEGQTYDSSASPRPYTVTVATVPQVTVALNGLDGPQGPFSRPGEIGTALAFTGQDRIEVPDQPAVNPGNTFTLEAWINPDRYADSYMPIIWKGDGGSGNYRTYSLWLNSSGYILLSLMEPQHNYNLTTPGGLVPLNTWTHVAAVADVANNTLTIYINGVQVAQQAFGAFTPAPTTLPLIIGSHVPAGQNSISPFEGLIDDVRIYSIARTATDIAGDMNTALSGNETGLTLYLPLDEATGVMTIVDKGPLGANGSVVHPYDSNCPA